MGGILMMITKPKQWLLDKVAATILKNAGDGKYGPRVKAVYWWIFNHAATWGVIAGIADFGLREFYMKGLCAPCAQIDQTLISVCGVLTGLGVVVGFHAAPAPAAPPPATTK